jgi:hypothetical protein
MELRPSAEPTNITTTQEFLNALWKSEVHYIVHNSPELLLILN